MTPDTRVLHTYLRSSAAYQVRIALNIKGLSYRAVRVHLLKDGGQQKQPAYKTINPSGWYLATPRTAKRCTSR